MLNVVIPMAGTGKRFADAGYRLPKPLIMVDNEPMIGSVLRNLNLSAHSFVTLVCLQDFYDMYGEVLHRICTQQNLEYDIVPIEKPTKGAACTLLEVQARIDNNNEFLFANCDQLVLQPGYLQHALTYWRKHKADGGIICFFKDHPQWSYVNLNHKGLVVRVVEKQVVSNFATVGIYYYWQGKNFVRCAKKMIEDNKQVNGEFYAAPVYNYLLRDNQKKVLPYLVNDVYAIGMPEDLDIYEKRPK